MTGAAIMIAMAPPEIWLTAQSGRAISTIRQLIIADEVSANAAITAGKTGCQG
jgi:hypothetical protein